LIRLWSYSRRALFLSAFLLTASFLVTFVPGALFFGAWFYAVVCMALFAAIVPFMVPHRRAEYRIYRRWILPCVLPLFFFPVFSVEELRTRRLLTEAVRVCNSLPDGSFVPLRQWIEDAELASDDGLRRSSFLHRLLYSSFS